MCDNVARDIWDTCSNDNGTASDGISKIVLGLPKFTGSMTHNFTYKNFDLTVALRGAAGFDIFNVHDFYFGLQSMSTNQLTTAYSKNAHITTGKNVITDYFIEPGDYLKIDNITLGSVSYTHLDVYKRQHGNRYPGLW